jgi:hypothetical protein
MSTFDLMVNEISRDSETVTPEDISDNTQAVLGFYNGKVEEGGTLGHGQRLKMIAWDQSLG